TNNNYHHQRLSTYDQDDLHQSVFVAGEMLVEPESENHFFRIYSKEEIDKARQSPSFEREYNLKYLGLIGNVFHTKDIESAIERGTKYNPDTINGYAQKSMGIDPGFSSSAFGVVVTQFVDGQIQIMHAEEYQRPDFNEMLSIVLDDLYIRKFKKKINNIFIDDANPSFIRALKIAIGESEEYEPLVERAGKMKS